MTQFPKKFMSNTYLFLNCDDSKTKLRKMLQLALKLVLKSADIEDWRGDTGLPLAY